MLEYLRAWMTTHLPKDEKGQDAAEYALLIGFIAMAIIIAVTLLATQIAAVFNAIGAAMVPWS
jgi:Flp pilus assembly pilin Flp